MPIICQICQTSFPKIIPWQHLKTHGITSSEYKEKFGPLYSPETLAKHSARTPHNKGKTVTDPSQKQKIKEAIARREERFRNGEIKRGQVWSFEHKTKLSQRTKDYAAGNPDEIKRRAQKAKATKIARYSQLPAPFAGRTHTNETKTKISQAAKEANKKKIHDKWSRITALTQSYNLTLMSEIGTHPLTLQCNKCNTNFEFTAQYFTPSKTFSEMCPACYPRVVKHSKDESELFEFVQGLVSDAKQGHRTSYHSFELDIFVPSKNVGIEYDGLYWHSEEVLEFSGKDKARSLTKKNFFSDQGIRVVTIYSDEWALQKDIVKSRLASILGCTPSRIFARQCQIKEISTEEASAFLKQNHIMGHGRSNVRLGLFYHDKLISVMTFSKSNLSRKVTGWELNRFASLLDHSVVGGASKLFQFFIKSYTPTTVISYADNRWSEGELYSTLGFSKVSNGTPNYWYFKPPEPQRIHRFTLRKSKADNSNLTEREIRKNQGFLRVWDCGSSKWVWGQK